MGSNSRFVSRALLTALVVALTGVVGLVLSPSASADVAIMPGQAQQGGAADVTFRVPDDRGDAYTTKVEVQLPEQTPVGEVYPMSVEGWAPTIRYRTLNKPIQGIHSVTNTITSAVVWTRVAKAPKGAWTINEMGLSMGPLPNVASLPFTVLQTYSDGVVRRWAAPGSTSDVKPDGVGPALTLTAGAPAAGGNGSTAAPNTGTQGMSGMEGMPGMGSPADVPADARTPIGTSSSSGPLRFFIISLIGGMLVFALVGGWIVARKRRPEIEVSEASASDADGTDKGQDDETAPEHGQKAKDEQHV